MLKAQLIIPQLFPSLNAIIAECRRNKYQAAGEKKMYTEIVEYHARAQKIISFPGKVFFTFVWIEKMKKRDKDNIAAGGRKVILDGLVNAGVLGGDNWNYVVGWIDQFAIDFNNPGVIVKMEEVQDDRDTGS